MRHTRYLLTLALLLGIAFLGCAADDNRPGDKSVIPESARQIIFDGGSEGPVVFEHERHSTDFFDGVCLFCHDHEAITTESHWSCRDCHSAGQDIEDLCEEVDIHHGCIMTQCQQCHDREGPPAPDGLSCGLAAGGCHK